jgi:hypothetical protein
MGYLTGANLYQLVDSAPPDNTDPFGLAGEATSSPSTGPSTKPSEKPPIDKDWGEIRKKYATDIMMRVEDIVDMNDTQNGDVNGAVHDLEMTNYSASSYQDALDLYSDRLKARFDVLSPKDKDLARDIQAALSKLRDRHLLEEARNKQQQGDR